MLDKLLFAIAFAVQAYCQPLEPRATHVDFTLYAYGDSSTGIGGLPIQYYDGLAYFTTRMPAMLNSTFQNVTFTAVDTTGNFTATTSSNETSLLYVPEASSGLAGFTNSTNATDILASSFGFYGSTAFVKINGVMVTDWYASPTSDSDIWELGWNSTSDDAIIVSLRSSTPSQG
ncbi:hypothetical protein BJ170DRAFT_109432 [Xylariales sp. AK1849]|nr:hypothetical protein BJ170DRAFT_109432 [Xylariales sp. AK1849]